jgi:hypothetical protein
LVAAARITNQSSIVPDYQDRLMAEILKQTKFPKRDRVSQMNIDSGGVDAVFNPEGLSGPKTGFQPFDQAIPWFDLFDAAGKQFKLFFDRFHG